MIFYFSATGNSKDVAVRLAIATDDKLMSMTDSLKQGTFDFPLEDDENLGFVTPVYHWGLPTVVVDFMKRLTLPASKRLYTYHVLTFGTTTGQAHRMMARSLQEKGYSLDGRFNVVTVDTWTPMFDLTDKEKIKRTLERADKQIDVVTRQISAKVAGDFDNRKVPFAQLYYRTYGKQSETRRFTVDGTCIGCGLCARQCPADAIEMRAGTPVWVKEHCAICLGCLHRCPKFAIQFGKRTRGHGQYVNPNVQL